MSIRAALLGLPAWLLTNNGRFSALFEVGVADLFWKSRAKRRLIRRASRAAECASSARGDPAGREGFSGFTSQSGLFPYV